MLEKIGVLRYTLYGDFWDVVMNLKPSDELGSYKMFVIIFVLLMKL